MYNNENPFDGLAPTPTVERTVEPIHYAKKYGEIERYVLKGTIVGECEALNGFEDLYNKANALVVKFALAFKDFSIIEDLGGGSTQTLYTGGKATVRSIDFEETDYSYLLPFTITLEVFNEVSFGLNFGVLNPVKSIDFQEQDDGTITINKTTSADGINTDTSAIVNAINFVSAESGLDISAIPLLMSGENIDNAVKVTSKETIDRMAGSYSLQESWIYDPSGRAGATAVIYTSTNEINYGQSGVKINVSGSISGGLDTPIEAMRTFWASLDVYDQANIYYTSCGYSKGLFAQALSKQISESSDDNKITFTHVFSDSIEEDPYLVDSISINKDTARNKNCVSAQVTIQSVDPCLSSRKTKITNYYDAFNMKSYIDSRLVELGYNFTLPDSPNSKSYSMNEKSGFISLSYAVCEKKITIPAEFLDISYSLDFAPAMPTFIPFQGIDDLEKFTIQELWGLKRRTVTIQGTATKLPCSSDAAAETSLLTYINNLKNTYLNNTKTFLSSHQIQQGTGNSKNVFTFSFSWNEEGSLELDKSVINS